MIKPILIAISGLFIYSCLSCEHHSQNETPQRAANAKVEVVTNGTIPSDWIKVHVCDLTFSMPPSLKEEKQQAMDSCIGVYESRDMRILLDSVEVGIEESHYSRRNEYASHPEFNLVERAIDGFEAEIITCLASPDAKLQYVTVLDVPARGLTIWIYSDDLEKQKTADQIVSSVEFDR